MMTFEINDPKIELECRPLSEDEMHELIRTVTAEDLRNAAYWRHKVDQMAGLLATETPREWLEGVDSMLSMPKPNKFSGDRWRQIQSDIAQFLLSHGARAEQLEWSTLDLFGVNVDEPDLRSSQQGLAVALHGDQISALTESNAIGEGADGTLFSIKKCKKPEDARIPLWDLIYEKADAEVIKVRDD